jgi:hypothetical protein
MTCLWLPYFFPPFSLALVVVNVYFLLFATFYVGVVVSRGQILKRSSLESALEKIMLGALSK